MSARVDLEEIRRYGYERASTNEDDENQRNDINNDNEPTVAEI